MLARAETANIIINTAYIRIIYYCHCWLIPDIEEAI